MEMLGMPSKGDKDGDGGLQEETKKETKMMNSPGIEEEVIRLPMETDVLESNKVKINGTDIEGDGRDAKR